MKRQALIDIDVDDNNPTLCGNCRQTIGDCHNVSDPNQYMQRHSACIAAVQDADELIKLREFKARVKKIIKQHYKSCGRQLNSNSSQLGRIIAEERQSALALIEDDLKLGIDLQEGEDDDGK